MRTQGKQLTKIVPTALLALLALIAIPTAIAHALSPYQSGYEHGVSDAKKAAQGLGHNDWYIEQPGKGYGDHTYQFNQGYVVGFNSVAGIPKDYKAGFQYGTNDWNQHTTNKTNYECPLSHMRPYPDFCRGYDAALVYQNSDM
jgi:hypothetical protein